MAIFAWSSNCSDGKESLLRVAMPAWLQRTSGTASELSRLKRVRPVKLNPGVYFLLDRSAVVYVGKSVNPWRRITEHVPNIEFDHARVLEVPPSDLCRAEAAFIRYYRPLYNTELLARASVPLTEEDISLCRQLLQSETRDRP